MGAREEEIVYNELNITAWISDIRSIVINDTSIVITYCYYEENGKCGSLSYVIFIFFITG